jgi:hypothetical protein
MTSPLLTGTAALFKADAAIFGRADDSNGSIGQVFRVDAAERFAHFAARCDDKAWITKTVIGLLAKNDYGARDTVVEHAKTYLPEQWMRTLADRCWELGSVPSVAADRFDLSRSLWLSVVTDIARVWNNAGDFQAALQWLDSVSQSERYMQYERDVELARAYQLLGRKSDLEQLLWRRFRDQPSVYTLRALVDVIGEEQRATAIADAASYVVQRRAQLNGDYWDSSLPLADGLTAGGQPRKKSFWTRVGE